MNQTEAGQLLTSNLDYALPALVGVRVRFGYENERVAVQLSVINGQFFVDATAIPPSAGDFGQFVQAVVRASRFIARAGLKPGAP